MVEIDDSKRKTETPRAMTRGHMLMRQLKGLAVLAVLSTMSTQAVSQVPSLKGGTKLSCAGGKVQGTSCVCPAGQEPVQVADHAWRCRAKKGPQLTTPTIRCEGGRVMGARCVCPAGKHPEQGVCKSARPTTPTDGKRYKLKVNSGQPGTTGSFKAR